MLEQFARSYPAVKRPPVASQWSMNYLSVLFPALLAGTLGRNREIPVWEAGIALLHDEARPAALHMDGGFWAMPAQPVDDYWQQVVSRHLEPLFATLSQWGGVSPKVLWGNVIAVWDGAFDRLSGGMDPDMHFAAYQWIDHTIVLDGRLRLRDQQRMVVSPAPDICAQIPLRKHCCLHYMLHAPVIDQPEVLCEACPRLHRQPPGSQENYLRSIRLGHG
ncbi:siderophore-iron reductase FhuF [Thalassospira marina]|uniref:Siderophore-iron reductase FhuF n=1 Tax=Thalassospira marina TaxID=2048283 RepID=A0A2N3L0H7_9PROT|nr:siderophore-iron reductase FhuF [Thalassospira marina]PKR56230.1 siderophore-iron reductase FhuF [Thalassospira marina]